VTAQDRFCHLNLQGKIGSEIENQHCRQLYVWGLPKNPLVFGEEQSHPWFNIRDPTTILLPVIFRSCPGDLNLSRSFPKEYRQVASSRSSVAISMAVP